MKLYRYTLIFSLSLLCGILPVAFPEWSDLLANQGVYTGYYGDINADSRLDLSDVILGLQVLSGEKKLPPISIYADINKDQRIGMEEVIYILQTISESRKAEP